VTARGEAGAHIYRDDTDRHLFLRVLRRVRSRLDWQCLAYCLMGNHYHLIIRTPRPNLVRGMQQLNGVYAQRFNHRHDRRRSHVFQGRYHSALVQRDAHLLEAVRYLAWNPVKAGLCETPEAWRWSSHRATLGLEAADIVDVEELLSHFGDTAPAAVASYATFIARADPGDPSPAVLGDVRFVRARLPPDRPSPEIPRAPWDELRLPLPVVLAMHDGDEGLSRAYREHEYTLREIAEATGWHYSTVSRRMREWEAECEK